jgi:hypothetical protein
MSYEETYRRRYACPCGKGEWEEVGYSNDWNQTRTDRTMLCSTCAPRFVWKDTTSDYEGRRMKGESGKWVPK